ARGAGESRPQLPAGAQAKFDPLVAALEVRVAEDRVRVAAQPGARAHVDPPQRIAPHAATAQPVVLLDELARRGPVGPDRTLDAQVDAARGREHVLAAPLAIQAIAHRERGHELLALELVLDAHARALAQTLAPAGGDAGARVLAALLGIGGKLVPLRSPVPFERERGAIAAQVRVESQPAVVRVRELLLHVHAAAHAQAELHGVPQP